MHALDDFYTEGAAFFAESTLDAFLGVMFQSTVMLANGFWHLSLCLAEVIELVDRGNVDARMV